MHPTPEQLLIHAAVRFLTPKQRKLWELVNYSQLPQDEIAKALGISQQAVSAGQKAIEKRISKWVKSNMGTYALLRGDYDKTQDD